MNKKDSQSLLAKIALELHTTKNNNPKTLVFCLSRCVVVEFLLVTHMFSQAICTGCQMFAAFVEMPALRRY